MPTEDSNSTTPSINPEAPDFHPITEYLLTAEQPTLQEFIDRNIETIASLSTPTTDLKRLWIGKYTQACQKLGKECSMGNTDWYSTMVTINRLVATPSTRSSSASPPQKSKHYFINQMEEAYTKMGNNKWVLPSGTTVEDIMVKYAREIPYEHPAHSFIFDTQDNCWNAHFSEEDLK